MLKAIKEAARDTTPKIIAVYADKSDKSTTEETIIHNCIADNDTVALYHEAFTSTDGAVDESAP